MALVGDGDNITRALAAIPTASRSAHSMYYAQEGRSRVLASQMGPVDLQVAGFRENNKWVFDSRSQKYTELAYPFSKSNKPNLDINYLDDLLVNMARPKSTMLHPEARICHPLSPHWRRNAIDSPMAGSALSGTCRDISRAHGHAHMQVVCCHRLVLRPVIDNSRVNSWNSGAHVFRTLSLVQFIK